MSSDPYVDPYSMNFYQMPSKKDDKVKIGKEDQKNIKIFRPYQPNGEIEAKKEEEKLDDKMPEFVDLTEGAYESKKRESEIESEEDDENTPILEELGIYPENIKQKMISVLTFHKIDKQILEDSDMAGPILVLILFAASLILQTKTHFGSLYGLSIFGSTMIFILMNLMSNKGILLYNTISVLGYCMLPVVILSFISIFLNMQALVGTILCMLTIVLSSYSATKFFEIVLSMNEQKWLIFYPVVLFYTCFVLLTIF